jgi:hypothetical protein
MLLYIGQSHYFPWDCRKNIMGALLPVCACLPLARFDRWVHEFSSKICCDMGL